MNYYFIPGYTPHHPRFVAPDTTDNSRHNRAKQDGGQWISQDEEMIYHFRYGDYWRAHWTGDRFGAWERSPDFPDGATRL